ncbi:LPS translocon maturation chaperone LptM [Neptunomonas concharum]|uniref:Lipoprotein n=1 Tax=Neptunomonas concharum TaxID=1031538 RepID=A0A5P1R761_9GAMM|nr:lipoprotein [Neptunomonas concharum]QEQ95458.1 lipoprotein [Neptunomonas concharum]
MIVKFCWIGIIAGVLLLSGCGQKGPLYLPEPDAPAQQNAQ